MNITAVSSAEAEKNQRAAWVARPMCISKAPTNTLKPSCKRVMLLEFILGARDFANFHSIYASKMRHLSKEHCKITQGGH